VLEKMKNREHKDCSVSMITPKQEKQKEREESSSSQVSRNPFEELDEIVGLKD
jgi:hypothetical protein